MNQEPGKLEKLLGQVYDELQSTEGVKASAEAKRDFIFHMTDWIDDLQNLYELYRHPESTKIRPADTVVGFLFHVIPHLKEAGRLLLDHIPDGFEEARELNENADVANEEDD